MTVSAPPAPRQQQRTHPAPVLKVTLFDRVSSFLMAAVVALLTAVAAIVALLPAFQQQTPAPVLPAVEFVSAGFEQGTPEERLNVDSPEEPIPNASTLNDEIPTEPVDARLESVMELAESAAEQFEPSAMPMFVPGAPGSVDGTNGPPLGDPDQRGTGTAPRWYVLFGETVSVEEYARQLEFFGIEPAAVFRERGELVYLSDLTAARPSTRVATSGDERLYMSWQGGRGRSADRELFTRAGVDVTGADLVHFYPARTEELLARLEESFSSRPVDQIQRTYFIVVVEGSGYSFAVTRQHYKR